MHNIKLVIIISNYTILLYYLLLDSVVVLYVSM